MSATHLGTIKTTNPGAQTNSSVTEGVTHTIIKTMSHVEAASPTSHPALGSGISVLGSVAFLINIGITYEPGEVATVIYNYGRAVASDDSNLSVSLNTDFGTRGNVSATPRGPTEFFESDCSLEQVSILRHPRYKSIPEADKEILGAMIQNGVLDNDGLPRSRNLSIFKKTKECAEKIINGQVSYLAKKYVWRQRRLNVNWAAGPTLGKISNPAGPAPNHKGNWLFVSVSGSGTRDKADELTFTWESSPEDDEWDEDLYK